MTKFAELPFALCVYYVIHHFCVLTKDMMVIAQKIAQLELPLKGMLRYRYKNIDLDYILLSNVMIQDFESLAKT